jgi:hypothetical protein
MLFGPKRVTVSTPAELDAAFETADEIVVEGADDLLEEAYQRIQPEPRDHHDLFNRSPLKRGHQGDPRRDFLEFSQGPNPGPDEQPLEFIFPFHTKRRLPKAWLAIGLGVIGVTDIVVHLRPNSERLVLLVEALKWPIVVIVAIGSMTFLAARAISNDRDVEVSWKVTEQASGRLVIRKVRERSSK